MENKVQQIQVLGHTVNWSCSERTIDKLSNLDELDITDAIELGFRNGNFSAHGAHSCVWWITDWETIAKELYNSILQVKHEILKYAEMDKIEIVDKAMSSYQYAIEYATGK